MLIVNIWRKICQYIISYKNKQRSTVDLTLNLFTWDNNDSTIRDRLIIVLAAFSLVFLLVMYRLIMLVNHDYINKHNFLTKSNYVRKDIVDRNGKLLAVNLPTASLFFNSLKVVNLSNSLESLKKIIPNLDIKKLQTEYKNHKSFVWVKRDLTPHQQNLIEDLGLPGFYFEKEQKRIYPYGRSLSHLIGYVGRDLLGFSGIEGAYDKFLSGQNEDDPANKTPTPKSLKLSIDVRLQNILNEEMQKTIDKFKALGGVGIIANPKNGEILAMVSKRDFDPHDPGAATSEELFNRASLGVNEVGSVFKALTIAIALDTEKVKINDAYDITHMTVGRFQVKDYHPRRGFHSVSEIFLHSSNIGVGQMILEVGGEDFKKYLKKVGILDQLKIELVERATPLYPYSKHWQDLSLVTMSYGYSLSISPLHFVQAMIPVVNGGILYPLTLIKKNNSANEVCTRVFKESTSKAMLKLMRLVVSKGTGKKAEVDGYLIGGKTGTANKASRRGYFQDKRISSFFGVLPASDPQYIIYVLFDEPKGIPETYGFATAGWTAAPTVGRILERMVTLYGLEPVNFADDKVQELLNIQYKVQNEI